MTHSDDFSIRPAVHLDTEDIARIYSAAILERNATMLLDPVSAKEMSHKLDTLAPRESIRVITDATDRVCGWGIVKMYSERPGYRLTCETSLFIDSQFRGKGLGKKMQLALHTTAQELGFHHIIVRIWAANETSIALHKTCGFSLVGIQKETGHVDQKWIDVAVMQCLLN